MGKELEWKLAVPDAATLDAVLAWEELRELLRETPRQYHMQTTYFDDSARSLFSRRITLRRRLENETVVFCVKAPLPEPAEAALRGEWEVCCQTLAEALPLLAAQGAPALLDCATLHPICGADFRRRAALLRFADGSACELALDCGTLSGPTETAPLCELELEMKVGAPDATLALLRRLAARFALSPEKHSKSVRARSLR